MKRYILIILILMSGCNNPVRYERIRIESGLDFGEFRDCIVFPRPSIGLMGGHICKEIDLETWHSEYVGYEQFDAMCWRSVDGGRNWTSRKITDGSFEELVVKDDIVYAKIYPKDNEWNYGTYIYESRNFGEDWTFKCGAGHTIVQLHVLDSSWMIGFTGNRLLETKDGGESWHFLKTGHDVSDEFHDGRYFYYFSHSKELVCHDLLIRHDLHTGEEKVLRLPAGFTGLDGRKNIIFCGNRETEELRVYRVNDDFSLTYLSVIKDGDPLAVKHIEMHGNEIYMFLVFKVEWLFSEDESFYYSSDYGKSWTRLGGKGYIGWTSNTLTSYMDRDGFKVVFCDNIYDLETFVSKK